MSLHPHPTYYTGQCLDYCHDDMHVDGDSCPTCAGYMTGCTDCTPDHIRAKRHAEKIRARRAQTTSAQAKTATPSGTEAGAPGREVESHSPATPSRPDAHQRVTSASPFAVEQEIGDEDWTVTVGLTDEAARQLARDLTRRHMADLVLLARLQAAIRRPHCSAANVEEHHHVLNRLAGALTGMTTTQWTLTPAQAEDLTDQLEEAQADPAECAVGTCSAYAIDGGSYCGPHEDGI